MNFLLEIVVLGIKICLNITQQNKLCNRFQVIRKYPFLLNTGYY
jgi:hypothetical protein